LLCPFDQPKTHLTNTKPCYYYFNLLHFVFFCGTLQLTLCLWLNCCVS